MYVTDYQSDRLEYDITQNDSIGSKFVIRIPQLYRGHFTKYKYQYRTKPYIIDYK